MQRSLDCAAPAVLADLRALAAPPGECRVRVVEGEWCGEFACRGGETTRALVVRTFLTADG